MKNILTSAIILAFTISAHAQCDELISTVTDRMTGATTTAAKDYIILSKDNKGGIALLFMASSKSVSINAKMFGASSCVDDDAKMYVLFTDGSRTIVENDMKFNCDKSFGKFYFNRKDQQLLTLASSPIAAIRVETYKGSVTEDVSPEQAEQIVNTLKCLLQ